MRYIELILICVILPLAWNCSSLGEKEGQIEEILSNNINQAAEENISDIRQNFVYHWIDNSVSSRQKKEVNQLHGIIEAYNTAMCRAENATNYRKEVFHVFDSLISQSMGTDAPTPDHVLKDFPPDKLNRDILAYTLSIEANFLSNEINGLTSIDHLASLNIYFFHIKSDSVYSGIISSDMLTSGIIYKLTAPQYLLTDSILQIEAPVPVYRYDLKPDTYDSISFEIWRTDGSIRTKSYVVPEVFKQ